MIWIRPVSYTHLDVYKRQAYALAAYMQKIKKIKVLPTYKEIENYLKTIVRMGSVDGVTKEQAMSVDGFSLEVEREILEELHRAVRSY